MMRQVEEQPVGRPMDEGKVQEGELVERRYVQGWFTGKVVEVDDDGTFGLFFEVDGERSSGHSMDDEDIRRPRGEEEVCGHRPLL